jgi:hypothetical protein
MDTTKEERAGWRKNIWCHGGKDSPLREEYCSVGGEDLERLLNDAERCHSLEGVVDKLQSLPEEDLTRDDLMHMMANATTRLAICMREQAVLRSQVNTLELALAAKEKRHERC